MYKPGYKKKISKNIKNKSIYYSFALFENETDSSDKLVFIRERQKKKRDFIDTFYEMNLNCKTINQKLFYEFCDSYIFNSDVKTSVIDNTLDIFRLPKRTMEHISYRSNGLNIKKANNGENSKLKNLRIWNDELSFKKDTELKSILDDEDINIIVEGVKSFIYNKEKQKEQIRNALRWCIRGLTAEKALLKIESEYKNKLVFIKRNAYKNRFKHKTII